MRIIHVIASLDPAQGGPPVIAENIAKAQTALGHDVRLASEVTIASPIPCVSLPRHSGRDLFLRPKPELLQLARTADILHVHGVWEPILPAATRAARQIGCPYILTPHGMLDPWSLAQKKWKKRLGLALGYRRMLNGASALHLGNIDEKTLIEPLRLLPRYELIPNGIFLDDVDPLPAPEVFRSSIPGLGDKPFILFLSRLHYKKGLDLLADAFAAVAPKHDKVHLVVAGPDGGEGQAFRERIGRCGLTGRTWLTGPLYGPEKWSALAGATVFCLPSRQEGFSVAILEALACRLPVVISDQCHFPEVAHLGGGRVVPLNANAVADALDQLLASAPERMRMGEAGRKMIESRYTWPKIAAQLLNLYESVIAVKTTTG